MYTQDYSFLFSVLESTDIIALLIDFNGNIIYLSPQLCRIFSINKLESELINHSADDLFIEMNNQLANGDLPFTINNKVDFSDEILISNKEKYKRKFNRILDADLNEFELWTFNFISSINIDFDHSFINTINTDILNFIPADIALFNLDHQYLFVNSEGIKSNSTKNWIIGKDDFDYCEYSGKPIELAQTRRHYFNLALKSGTQIDFEEESTLKDGTTQTHLRIFLPIKNEFDEFSVVVGYGINISSTKALERQNELVLQNLEKLFNNSDSILFAVDSDGIIRYINPAFEDFYQLSKHEICNTIHINYFFVSERQENTVDKNIQILKTISTKGISHQFQAKIIESVNSNHNNSIKYYFLTDITNDVLIKNQLQDQMVHDRKLNIQKSNFISIVSHELRTPLSIILSNVEILQILISNEQSHSKTYNKNFDKIYFQINKMIEMIGKYLYLNKLESLLYKPEREKINLKEFLSEIINEKYIPWIDGRKLEYKFKTNHKNAQAEIINANKDNLIVVISNLIDNAFKYSANSNKSPIFRVSIKEKYYSVLIIDFGIGISKSEFSLIFKPFVRGSNVGNISGSGFGLMFVNQFINFISGEILIRSTKNKYTIINIQIPLIKAI